MRREVEALIKPAVIRGVIAALGVWLVFAGLVWRSVRLPILAAIALLAASLWTLGGLGWWSILLNRGGAGGGVPPTALLGAMAAGAVVALGGLAWLAGQIGHPDNSVTRQAAASPRRCRFAMDRALSAASAAIAGGGIALIILGLTWQGLAAGGGMGPGLMAGGAGLSWGAGCGWIALRVVAAADTWIGSRKSSTSLLPFGVDPAQTSERPEPDDLAGWLLGVGNRRPSVVWSGLGGVLVISTSIVLSHQIRGDQQSHEHNAGPSELLQTYLPAEAEGVTWMRRAWAGDDNGETTAMGAEVWVPDLVTAGKVVRMLRETATVGEIGGAVRLVIEDEANKREVLTRLDHTLGEAARRAASRPPSSKLSIASKHQPGSKPAKKLVDQVAFINATLKLTVGRMQGAERVAVQRMIAAAERMLAAADRLDADTIAAVDGNDLALGNPSNHVKVKPTGMAADRSLAEDRWAMIQHDFETARHQAGEMVTQLLRQGPLRPDDLRGIEDLFARWVGEEGSGEKVAVNNKLPILEAGGSDWPGGLRLEVSPGNSDIEPSAFLTVIHEVAQKVGGGAVVVGPLERYLARRGWLLKTGVGRSVGPAVGGRGGNQPGYGSDDPAGTSRGGRTYGSPGGVGFNADRHRLPCGTPDARRPVG